MARNWNSELRIVPAALLAFGLGSAAMAQDAAPSVSTEMPGLSAPSAPADQGTALPAASNEAAPQRALPGAEAPAAEAATPAADSAAPAEAVAPATDLATAEAATELTAEAPAEEPVPLTDIFLDDPQAAVTEAAGRAHSFLVDGGPSIWAIAALSVITVALILWKIWRFFIAGAWSRRASRKAVEYWEAGQTRQAYQMVAKRRGLRSRLTAATMRASLDLPEDSAREEASRVAKRLLGAAGTGLRPLELIATIAPLLGLLGTVLGMISAFQALQEAGNNADPAMLAGGIWEALLTTAAGMAVAIPASAALTWFEAVIDSVRQDMEDLAARIFIAGRGSNLPRQMPQDYAEDMDVAAQ
ncbi:MotA/TolQ/ExbB proton channel family protein [Pseudooceanicola nanhaiensis]|uniref:MotA/TolQ/ExbB proton channel family protein n=1 Tax=Pseudooceanicola nanhaiensis TaxID=375761 RepID=UPI001CD6EFC8|nr:MotA/TolQ/ExbB proton channel family protein [Pseudooceanicola nanhaiensis]MCA0921390.1 MotA/TolQ/ExbB proton channel family protein [Pseudooceanicola nanhaiensis]